MYQYHKVLSRCPICLLWSYGYYNITEKLPKSVEYFPIEFYWQVGECCGYDNWFFKILTRCATRILVLFKDKGWLWMIEQTKVKALGAPEGQEDFVCSLGDNIHISASSFRGGL